MKEKTVKYIKILWLPALILLLMVIEPYTGILKSQYAILYFILQMALFVIYVYILVKSGLILSPKKLESEAMKGKRKPKKK